MARYLLKRIGYILISLFFIITITFGLMKLAPGGPFTSERKTSPAIERQMKEAYGLNDPIHEQYFKYLINAAKFDFGPSFKYEGQEVTDIIKRSFPYSLILGLEAIFIALAFGVLFGTIAAIRHNKTGDYTVMVIAILGISVPSFIMATILQFIFSMKLELLPIARFESFAHTILPAFALGDNTACFYCTVNAV